MMKDWVEIISFRHSHKAHLAKGLLEASGIEVMIKDEYMSNYSKVVKCGMRLFVEKSRVEEAIAILVEGGYINLKTPIQKW